MKVYDVRSTLTKKAILVPLFLAGNTVEGANSPGAGRLLYSNAQVGFDTVTFAGTDLDQAAEQGYLVNADLFAQFGETGNYTLSKHLFYDGEDPMAANLTIYGTQFTRDEPSDNSVTFAEDCDAEFGDTLCTECGICKIQQATEFTIQDGVLFDCSGIVENRVCTGNAFLTTQEMEELDEGTRCYGSESGIESCFVDAAAVTPPNASATSAPGEAPATPAPGPAPGPPPTSGGMPTLLVGSGQFWLSSFVATMLAWTISATATH